MQHPKPTLAGAALALQVPAANASASNAPTNEALRHGWVLKKRRKKLQGFARRYFVLHYNGSLTYSFEPGSTTRDKIYLPGAAISSSPGRKDIHVDSGTVTFHMKCLTSEDFNYWMDGLRKFTPTGSEMEKITLRRSVSRKQSHGVQIGKLHHANLVLDEMAKVIDDLEACCYPLEEEKRSTTSSDRTRAQSHESLKQHHRDDKSHSSFLSMFKKPQNAHQQPGSPGKASFSKEGLPPSNSSPQLLERLVPLLSKLRDQHSVLTDLLQSVSVSPVHPHRTPVQRTIDEEGADSENPSWVSNRSSMSTVTDSGSVWFDATSGEDLGAEEYIVPVEQNDEDPSSKFSQISESESASSMRAEDETPEEMEEEETPYEKPDLPIDRRTRLPQKTTGDEGSLFAVLKKNVGQDLSNIAFPVSFNEPLTLLQRAAEEMEYFDLLNTAASISDWVERICYVAAFAVSGYACTKHRSGRKGFTPLLAETFEDSRMNFIAEKVVHKPLTLACHASGKGWELNATSSGKTKFWGKSFEVIPTGATKVRIGDDEYEWNKPSSFTRNLMMGTKYLEHCGEMVVTNTRTGARCVLDFKETGYWASTPNVVSGVVHSPDGKTVSKLEGKWDESMSQKLDSNHLKILWRVSPYPRDASDYYGFTYFGITLNEITPDIKKKLPPTDSRYRSDVRALENGDIDVAEREKARIEQMQRDRRVNGKDVSPRWFAPIEGSDEWAYVGGYWEARKNGWKDVNFVPLW